LKIFSSKSAWSGFAFAPLLVAIALSPATAAAQCQSCVNSVTLPASVTYAGIGTNVSATDELASAGDGYLTIQLSNVPAGLSIGNQLYPVWCGSWWSSVVQTNGAAGYPLYSTYSPAFPTGALPIVGGSNLNMVNYILNHKAGTVQDVQDAIWLIVTGQTSDIPSTTAVSLAAAAKLNPNYIPDGGGVMGAFLAIGPGTLAADSATAANQLQSLLLEIPVPVSTQQNCSGCVSSIALPAVAAYSGIGTNVQAETELSSAGDGYFAVQLAGVQPGFSIGSQVYAAWCAGWWSSVLQSNGSAGFGIYSTYGSNLPAGFTPSVAGSNFNMVNYILNHKSGTVQDVQDAIWTIVTGQIRAGHTLSAAASAMVTAAQANPAYCPPTGGVIALFLAVNTGTLAADSATAANQLQSLLIEVKCTGVISQGTPRLSLKKTANVTKVNPFQKVTYTYVVTNTGTVALSNVAVVDDNGTPTYPNDDFTVGTVASLAPGASATLTATIYPPVTEAANYDEGWGLNWGWTNYSRGWDFDDDNALPGGTVICKDDGKGKLQFTYKEDTHHTDNSFGRNASWDWGRWGHNFSSMASNDGAQFQILDKDGNICLDFVADYVSPSPKAHSGYGTLGVKGGGGGVYKGDSSKILAVETSLSHNLNAQTKYHGYTKDSPPAGTADWDFNQSYTVTIDTSVCGTRGFGGVKLPIAHNYPAKWSGCDARVMRPTSSTVTNTAVASVTVNGTLVKATARATVTIDASRTGWSQCRKY
jgi:hypothetical protein